MKKLILLGSLFLAIFLVNTEKSYASNFSEGGVTVYKKEKIEDNQLLFERAKKGVTDKRINNIKQKGVLNSVEKDRSIEIDILETTELLEKIIDADGNEITSYATTYFVPITEDDLEATAGTLAAGGTSTSGDKSDSTFSATGITTMHYTVVTDDSGNQYYKWSRQTGTWQALTSGITFSNRSVKLNQLGYPIGGGGLVNPTKTESVSHSYDINVASYGWVSIFRGGSSIFGAKPKVTLTRGSSNWVFEFDHNMTF
ncbi:MULTISPECIES: hypothetical protein [unclassified Sporosarcina]|uniref:hypothetical protein n=1 Tax=unclassified Sporosarcina TaxID=2647733 RepID=UPI001A933CE2|nr:MULTISPECIES: hypothetical protein [unclassified Sporosarcina]MBO0588364.1 hypothetical protein [Sporosarcina sp. E16_8]MBO0603729.1 hypothetical protein [Sporosarcina sp. E16_3]